MLSDKLLGSFLGYFVNEDEEGRARMDDLIRREDAIDAVIAEGRTVDSHYLESERIIHVDDAVEAISMLPSAQSEEVIPHRNYKYLSDYWCECGWHLGKKGEVKYCSECGRKVNWDG